MTNVSTLCTTDRDTMIIENLPQVKLIARRIHDRLPGNVSLDDLVSAGTLGLISAVDRFDAKQGVKLKTYAEFKIRGAILDSLRSVDWAPRQQRRRARLIATATAQLENLLHRTATEDEVAVELGITVSELREWKGDVHGLTVTSLDSVTSDEDGRDLLQFVSTQESELPSAQLEQSELKLLVARALARMPQVERTVITLYYQQEKTLREISSELNLHESRISQLKTQGLGRLRAFLAQRWPNRGAGRAA